MNKKDEKILNDLGKAGMVEHEFKYQLSVRATMKNIIDGDGTDEQKKAGFLFFLCAEQEKQFEMMVQLLSTMSIFDIELDKHNIKKDEDDSFIKSDVNK